MEVQDAARRDPRSPRTRHATRRLIETIEAHVHVDARVARRDIRGEVRAPGHQGGVGAGHSEATEIMASTLRLRAGRV